MDTLLYVGQIVLGTAVLAAGLHSPAADRTGPGTASTSVTSYDDSEVSGGNRLFGVVLAGAAIASGATGVAGLSVLPAPVGLLVTGVGLISVLLAADTTTASAQVAVEQIAAIPAPRSSSEVVTIAATASRAGSRAVQGSRRHAA